MLFPETSEFKMQLFVKLRNLYNYIEYLFIDYFLLSGKKRIIQPNTLLIIRLDAIGDYLLFRNILSAVKISRKFKNYKIALCGNKIWKNLSEYLDKDFVDEFIWLDREKFYKNISYKINFLTMIRKRGFEIVIEATHSREILYGDLIVNSSNAIEKIGSQGSADNHVKWKRNLFTNKYYTQLIPVGNKNVFEFNYNKRFFENILNERLNISSPYINHALINDITIQQKPYVVLFHGAARKEKIWNHKNFVETAQFLIENFLLDVVLAGGTKEIKNSFLILASLPGEKVINMTGKTSLTGLVKIISNSELLISNDTSAVHFAASVGKKFICISNGERFGRFHPYPKEIFDKAYYIYPSEIINKLDDFEYLSKKYRFSSDLDINEIRPETVKEVIRKIMK